MADCLVDGVQSRWIISCQVNQTNVEPPGIRAMPRKTEEPEEGSRDQEVATGRKSGKIEEAEDRINRDIKYYPRRADATSRNSCR